jgi:hypothetical protein
VTDRFLFPPIERAQDKYPCLLFNGTSTIVYCGSDSSLDDLPAGAVITVDAWFNSANLSSNGMVACKADYGDSGFYLWHTYTARLYFSVVGANNIHNIFIDISAYQNQWLHAAGYFDDSTKTINVALNGAWAGATADAGMGAYVTDAAMNFYIGRQSDTTNRLFDGKIGWVRLSDNDRYGGASDTGFTVPGRYPAPATDVHTIEQWNLDEKFGTTAAAQVSSPTNDGTIANGTWIIA